MLSKRKNIRILVVFVSALPYIESIQFQGSSHLLWRSHYTTKWKVSQTSTVISHERREIKQFDTYFCLKSSKAPELQLYASCVSSFLFFNTTSFCHLGKEQKSFYRRTTFSIFYWQKKHSKELD